MQEEIARLKAEIEEYKQGRTHLHDTREEALNENAHLKAEIERKDAKIREFIFAFDEPPTYIESERYLNAIREIRSEVEG
jgi:uncharacterized small protein (DUF1192 family)